MLHAIKAVEFATAANLRPIFQAQRVKHVTVNTEAV